MESRNLIYRLFLIAFLIICIASMTQIAYSQSHYAGPFGKVPVGLSSERNLGVYCGWSGGCDRIQSVDISGPNASEFSIVSD
jgi:hypothetical protein